MLDESTPKLEKRIYMKIQSNINVQIKDGDVIRFGRDEYILQLR